MTSEKTLDPANTKIHPQRKRKTKRPCSGCGLNPALCLCALIPSLNFKTKISLVIHAKEMKRTTNTGRLALKALVNSEMRVRGLDHTPLDLSDLLTPDYETFLFLPSETSLELNKELIQKIQKPIQLIVPDGNWRQASKVNSRHPELAAISRLMISEPNLSTQFLRAESSNEGMATLQAIAKALAVIEGESAAKPLLDLYNEKLERTLIGRGQKI